MTDIIWDPDFDTKLHKLGDYFHGWQVNLYPEGGIDDDDDPTIMLEPFRQGETTHSLWHKLGLTLWSQPNNLVFGRKLKEFLEERVEDLEEIINGFETVWNGNNHVGRLTEDAEDALQDIQMTMEDKFSRYAYSLPQYWDVWDWFSQGEPDPEHRDVDTLLQEAEDNDIYLDREELESYLEQLELEEAFEDAEELLPQEGSPQPTLH
ncbi:MAG: hypothetical protein GF334_12835 [Candidatus Altiarchaeales archaeon]|nr:hypothetical protein [Candidatus Altiarchaeales archaeon]